jgi:hypothetical protein
MRFSDECLGNRPEKKPLEARVVVRPDDQEIGLRLVDHLQDFVSRIADEKMPHDLISALPASASDEGFEMLLRVRDGVSGDGGGSNPGVISSAALEYVHDVD